jgi:ribosomal protein S18 acetylase RimI-like enzyme
VCVVFDLHVATVEQVRANVAHTRSRHRQDLRAVALPPLRPAAFFCAVVPPCDELLFELDELDFFPPRLDAPGELAIFAARSFDIPLSFNASYCFSFLTFELLPGNNASLAVETRRLRRGDDTILESLATYPYLQEQSVLLDDERTFLLVAFDGEAAVGFVLAHELPRRHGDPSNLFVYEGDVVPNRQREGIATAPMRDLERQARARGIREAFLFTEPDNAPANALDASLGGRRETVIQWDFEYTDS